MAQMTYWVHPKVVMSALVRLVFIGTACGQQKPGRDPQQSAMPDKTIDIVLQKHSADLRSLPGVVGTTQGGCSGDPCILVLVAEKPQELIGLIPPVIEGYRVSVVETGEFHEFDTR